MTKADTPLNSSLSRYSIWMAGVLFVLFQFFLQLSSGIIIGNIMHDMSLSALTAGLLSSSFYFIYTSLQIPAGILFDIKNSRFLLTSNALLCCIGCLIFAQSSSLWGLFLGRILIGAGSSFAFIGLSHLLRQYFPTRQFAFMIGLSETLGFIATAIGIMGMGEFVAHWGWRSFINGAALVGLIIAYLCWRNIPNSNLPQSNHQYKQQFFSIIQNRYLWINGAFVGLSFAIVTVFGALWAAPFIQAKIGCNLQTSALICASFFIGTGFSCPLFGLLSNHVQHRNLLLSSSCIITSMLLLILFYIPTQNTAIITIFMFSSGLCCGAYMLAYSISNELAPPQLQSAATGFTNTLAVLSAPLLQPLVGLFLDAFKKQPLYTIVDYQRALLVVPGALFLAGILVLLLPRRIAAEGRHRGRAVTSSVNNDFCDDPPQC